MPLLAVLDEAAHGALEESLKTLYVQNSENKQFYLNIEPDEAGKLAFNLQTEVKNKKAALDKVHNEKKELAEKVAAFDALGKSAEEIKAALESNRPEEVSKLIQKYEQEKEQLRKSFEEPLKAAEEEKRLLRSQIEDSVLMSCIAELQQKHQLNDAAPFVLKSFLKPVAGDDGKYSVQVVDDNGQPALTAGGPTTTDDLIKSWREGKKFESIFNAGTGGGTGTNDRSYTSNNSQIYEGLSPQEKLTLAREKGLGK